MADKKQTSKPKTAQQANQRGPLPRDYTARMPTASEFMEQTRRLSFPAPESEIDSPDYWGAMVDAGQAEAEAAEKAAAGGRIEASQAPLSAGQEKGASGGFSTVFDGIDIEASTGTHYATTRPEKINFILQGLPEGSLGALVAAPGAGKSTAFAQLCAAAGAGVPWLGIFPIERACRVLFLSGEELQPALHQRVHDAITRLPSDVMDDAASRIVARSIRGDVAILKERGLMEKTKAWFGLLRLLDKVKPDLLLLDHFPLFVHLENENNNVKIKEACTLLDGVCEERNLTIIAASHVSKANARIADSQEDLRLSLDATAARGGTALTGAVRWQCNMSMLTQNLAGKIVGNDGKQRPDGAFIGVKITKVNYGPLSEVFYLERKQGSPYLERANVEYIERKQQSLDSDVEHLVAMVRKRKEQGLPPFSWSSGIVGSDDYSDADGEAWGTPRYHKARNSAEARGLLERQKKAKGNGEILVERMSNSLLAGM